MNEKCGNGGGGKGDRGQGQGAGGKGTPLAIISGNLYSFFNPITLNYRY